MAHTKTIIKTDDPEDQNRGEDAQTTATFGAHFRRHYKLLVALLAGLAWGIMVFLRYNMTVAVLQMVNQTHLFLEEHPNSTLEDFEATGRSAGGEFNWNNEIVAIILGCYMISYTLPQTLVARLNIAIGCRLAVPIGLAICSAASLLTPSLAPWGWQWVVACRLVNGLGASGVMPAMLALLERWFPYDEIQLGLTYATIAFALMTSVCPLASGYLASVHWSLAFYVPSYFTLAFCLLFVLMVTDEPAENWLLNLGGSDRFGERSQEAPGTRTESSRTTKAGKGDESTGGCELQTSYKPDSWLQIFQQRALYMYMAIWALHNVCFNGLTFTLPTYLEQFLNIPVAENGLYGFVIQSGVLLAISWPHQVLKQLLKRGLSLTQARNIVQALCCLMMTATFCYVGFFHRNQVLVLFLNRCFLTADIVLTGSIMSNFAMSGLGSVAFAMVNTVGNLSVAGVAPLIGLWLDCTGSSRWGWQVVFLGMGATQLAIFFIFWLSLDSEPIKFRTKRKSPME